MDDNRNTSSIKKELRADWNWMYLIMGLALKRA
jgi:hypothetical protein